MIDPEGPAIACFQHPEVPACFLAASTDGPKPLCGECGDKMPGPMLQVIPLAEQVAAQAMLDDLMELLNDDGALGEAILDWEVNGGGFEE